MKNAVANYSSKISGKLLMGIVSLFAPALAAGDAPTTLAKGTRQLSTAELNAKLVGREIELVVVPEMRWLHPGEYFYRDGRYMLYGHQEKWTGSYTIRDNVVCTRVENGPETCRFIFADVDGLFWIAPNKIYPDQFRQIRLKTIEERNGTFRVRPREAVI